MASLSSLLLPHSSSPREESRFFHRQAALLRGRQSIACGFFATAAWSAEIVIAGNGTNRHEHFSRTKLSRDISDVNGAVAARAASSLVDVLNVPAYLTDNFTFLRELARCNSLASLLPIACRH